MERATLTELQEAGREVALGIDVEWDILTEGDVAEMRAAMEHVPAQESAYRRLLAQRDTGADTDGGLDVLAQELLGAYAVREVLGVIDAVLSVIDDRQSNARGTVRPPA